MRVALNELAADAVADLGKGKVPGLTLDLRMKTTCISTSPSSSHQLRVIQVDGVHGLVGFLQKFMRMDVGLHFVPGAAVFGSRRMAMMAARSSAVYCCFQGVRS